MAAVVSHTADEVRGLVYRSFVSVARAPSVDELVAAMKVPEAEVLRLLGVLHQEKRLVMEKDGRTVRLAMPFSAPASKVRVEARGLTWYCSCIYESFGIADLLGEDSDIHAMCLDCEQDQIVSVRGGEIRNSEAVVHFPLPARTWWGDIVNTCRHIHLFRSEDHVDRWCNKTGTRRGETIEVERQMLLSQAWYADRLDPAWRWPGAAFFQEVLANVGLTGPFWELPG